MRWEHILEVRSPLLISESFLNDYPVAYKRFSDNIPLAVDNGLVRGFGHDLLKKLTTGLRIYGPDGEEV